jgi:hypothetical protein
MRDRSPGASHHAPAGEILIQTNQTAQENKAVSQRPFHGADSQAELDLAAVDEKIKQFKDSHWVSCPSRGAATERTQWSA